MFDILEKAIQCFEKWSNTKVMLYDFNSGIGVALPYSRRLHLYSCCEAAKKHDNGNQCVQFDYWNIQREIWRYREGGLKICHCNLIEWVIPIYAGGKLLCILEAGIRRPANGVVYSLPVISCPVTAQGDYLEEVPILRAEEAEWVMEGLRQLAARLLLWHQGFNDEIDEPENIPRHLLLHKIIRKYARTDLNLGKLADMMHLSSSRTAHVIKELTGKNFKEILNDYRLYDACLRLKTTTDKVEKVAVDCGFQDIAHFYRLFKQKMKMTPRQYRNVSNILFPLGG